MSLDGSDLVTVLDSFIKLMKGPDDNVEGDHYSDKESVNVRKSDNVEEASSERVSSENNSFSNGVKHHDDRNLRGKLVSLESEWGLVAVEDQVYVFHSNCVEFFGLKIENLPLDAIFSPDQHVSLSLDDEKVTSLTYGCKLTSSLREKAISEYCTQASVSNNIKNLLEELSKQVSQNDT